MDKLNPDHYKMGKIECIEAIESALTPDELRGYYKGSILKYTWRERHKNGAEDIGKAKWFADRLVELIRPDPVAQ